MTKPTVFLSYSHQDEAWKDRVSIHLRVWAELEVWDDRRIELGDDWRSEIQTALQRADVAVLLVSANFLTSRFILEEEIPVLLRRRKEEGLLVIPVILRPCDWQAHDWLESRQAHPKDARPISKGADWQIDEDFTDLAKKIRVYLEGSGRPSPARGRGDEGEGFDLGRLPTPGPVFVGRDAELAQLDAAWENPQTHVLTFVAFGGVGKSALLARWVDQMAADNFRGAERVLDWSFYSQGSSEDREASAEPFLDYALRFFGDPHPQAGSPHDRGKRLASLVRQRKTLLLLDGVEPLQYGLGPLVGQLKDPGLKALLKGLAVQNPGLCVVTTRERIADLNASLKTAPQDSLEGLSVEAGVELLRSLKIAGSQKEMAAAVEEFQRHALSLTLLGSYLHKAHQGDIRKRKEVDLETADQRQGGHAFRVIAAYTRWLREGPELAILRLLGLFDRPAHPKALAALRAEPAIPGLTESLVGISSENWRYALSNLRDHALLAAADPQQPEMLDIHPLVRAYFQEEMEKRPETWREGNLRLYEFLRNSAPDHPDTLEAMQPLYAAVVHGCRAGRTQEAMIEVYWRRILRRGEQFSWKKLGAFGSELPALAGFFERPWSQPSPNLTAADRAFVLNQAGIILRALGRLGEAVEPIKAGLEERINQQSWDNAARSAGNLSELILTLGEVAQAVSFGKQGAELAESSGETLLTIIERTIWADAMHQAGRLEESAAAFREAEARQAEWQPPYPWLYSIQGHRYCDLLLGWLEPEDGSGLDGLVSGAEVAERFREVLKRASQTLAWVRSHNWLLDIALDHLTLGRAYLGLARTALTDSDAHRAQAAEYLDLAVDGLRQAGDEDVLPSGLLARANFRRLSQDFLGATEDLDEAQETAERGGMRLHECDANLERARLCRDQNDLPAARRHLARAAELVEQTGYLRRAREVAFLKAALAAAP